MLFGVQIRYSVLFDGQYLSAFGHSAFGHLMLGPYLALGPIRRLVIRRSVIRRSVIRHSVIWHSVIRRSVIRRLVIRRPVFRRSVIRRSVIRRPVFRRSVGESRQVLFVYHVPTIWYWFDWELLITYHIPAVREWLSGLHNPCANEREHVGHAGTLICAEHRAVLQQQKVEPLPHTHPTKAIKKTEEKRCDPNQMQMSFKWEKWERLHENKYVRKTYFVSRSGSIHEGSATASCLASNVSPITLLTTTPYSQRYDGSERFHCRFLRQGWEKL
jgi:hypothetical protein